MSKLTDIKYSEPEHYSKPVDKVLLWWYNSKKYLCGSIRGVKK